MLSMFFKISLPGVSPVFTRTLVLFDWGSKSSYACSPKASSPQNPSPVTILLHLKIKYTYY